MFRSRSVRGHERKKYTIGSTLPCNRAIGFIIRWTNVISMQEVSVSRDIDATPVEISAQFDPAAIVEAEGSFSVESVDEGGETTIVVASGPGLQFPLRFEYREDALYYTQDSRQGPFEQMETWLTFDVEDGTTQVTFQSAVSLSVPVPFSDRVAAWKRKRELERALETIAEAVT